ncbi:hypothetical protein [Rhodococcus qingshengii]|uniref:hypothetical protein n=1 Tax=Rhodococcus qingshengii TaxID=334542 RepID=UPI0033D5E0E4
MTTFFAVATGAAAVMAMVVSTPPVMHRRHAGLIYWASWVAASVFLWLADTQRSILGYLVLGGFAAVWMAWRWTPFLTKKHPNGFDAVDMLWLTRIIDRNKRPVNRYDKPGYTPTDHRVRDR